MQNPRAGHKCKLYRNTGTYDTPVWSEVEDVEDVNLSDLSMGMAELKRRAKDFTKNLPSLIQTIAIEFTLQHGLESGDFNAIRTKFFAGTAEEYLIADGASDSSGTEGLRCPMLVENFPWNQPLEDVNNHDIRLVCAYMEEADGTEIDPVWFGPVA
jgi:hypothetical protein